MSLCSTSLALTSSCMVRAAAPSLFLQAFMRCCTLLMCAVPALALQPGKQSPADCLVGLHFTFMQVQAFEGMQGAI